MCVFLCNALTVLVWHRFHPLATARSRKDETQYSGQNRNRNPRWSSQIFSNGSFEHSIAPNRLLCSSFEKQISTVEAEFEKIL